MRDTPLRRWFRIKRRSIRLSAQRLLSYAPGLRPIRSGSHLQSPPTLSHWFFQKIIGINRDAYWPVHRQSRVTGWQNILVGVDSHPGYEPGCYIQGIGKIEIGDYSQFACNVGIISANHQCQDSRNHDAERTVKVGSYCWVGMNSVILPGVTLGDFTIVGAGSVVTKSFPEGHVVIAGNPAKQIRQLEPSTCNRYRLDSEYIGYIRKEHFDGFRSDFLNV